MFLRKLLLLLMFGNDGKRTSDDAFRGGRDAGASWRCEKPKTTITACVRGTYCNDVGFLRGQKCRNARKTVFELSDTELECEPLKFDADAMRAQ